jgi:P3 major capsid protein
MQGQAAAAPAGNQPNPAALNLAARNLLVRQCVDAWLPIATGTITTGVGSVVNVPGRNVGLVKRFLIELALPITPSAQNQAVGPLGPAAILSNVLLTDLSNQIRVNTTGWHLVALSSVKRRKIWGAAYITDTPLGYGNNYTNIMAAPALTGGGGATTIYATFEVPVSYTDHDLRGAIYAAVTNATFNLQFTLNPNMFAISTTPDPTFALYKSAGAGAATLGTVTYTVYQNFLDQIPRDPKTNAPLLPLLDLGTAYLLNVSPFGALVANSDNPFPYPNFRDIMSSTVIFDNGGTLNAGSDVAYWALQTANYTNIFKLGPRTTILRDRTLLGDDPPAGMYYFDHRDKPVNTLQYGNMALLLNPSTVNAGAAVYFGYESLALIGMITGAGSLAGT